MGQKVINVYTVPDFIHIYITGKTRVYLNFQ